MITAWIAGDCWLGPGAAALNLRALWSGTRPDLFVLNLECAVPVGPARLSRRALLPLDSSRLAEIAQADNTVCVLANNHVTDFGSEGLLTTIIDVRRAGMAPLGAGPTLAEARAPVIVNVHGRRIGLLAYADVARHVGAVAATDRTAGVAPLAREMVLADVHHLANQVDDVWLILHWGLEFIRYPEPEQRAWAGMLAEAGATLIVGTHPHVVRGNEKIGSAAVYYSLGNFVFPPVLLSGGEVLSWDRAGRRGLTLRGTVERGG